VFPSVVKAGLGLGGEYGEGCSSSGRPSGYYNLIQARSAFSSGCKPHRDHMFMTEQAWRSFESN
jgi:lipid-binding SYLF domain-containing protein